MFIVITDFNGFSQTRRCLAALRASRFQNFTTVVVDHGTSNETRNNLAEEFPEVIRLSGAPHLWWAGATNIGIRYSLDKCAKAVMLLNNDCYVTPDTIGELFALWTEHQGAIIAPIQRDCQSGAITTITPSSSFLLGFPSLSGPRQLTSVMQEKRLIPTKIIAGGRGALINTLMFRAVGLFDEEHLPHYGADHDFYLKASQKGVALLIATRAFVDVDNSRTTIANHPERLTLQQWVHSLRSFHSHHNLAHVTELFKRHYPFRRLYMFGVMLYTGRYFIIYLFRRMVFLLNKFKIS